MFKLRRTLVRHRPQQTRGIVPAGLQPKEKLDNRAFVAMVVFLTWMFGYKGPQYYKKHILARPSCQEPYKLNLVRVQPRDNYRKKLVGKEGLTLGVFKTWNEGQAIELSAKEEKKLIEATFELHSMCLEAVDTVIQNDELLRIFEIPEGLWPILKKSWEQRRPDLIGRLDFTWSKGGTPKLLAYKAEAPSKFVQSAEASLNWQKDKFPQNRQCNFLKDALQEGLKHILESRDLSTLSSPIGFSSSLGDDSMSSANYMAELTRELGLKSVVGPLGQLSIKYNIGPTEAEEAIFLLGKEPIQALFLSSSLAELLDKENPLFHECDQDNLTLLEPAWKMVLGHKALLALLWEMYPNHPNLTAAYLSERSIPEEFKLTQFVVKQKTGKGHVLTSLRKLPFEEKLDKLSLEEEVIFQEFGPLPGKDQNILTSTWVVKGQPAGVCFQVDSDPVLSSSSRFLLHYIPEGEGAREWKFNLTNKQALLREALYGTQISYELYDSDKNLKVVESSELSKALPVSDKFKLKA